LFGGSRRFAAPTLSGFFRGFTDECDQAVDGVFAIAILGSIASRFNDQYAFSCHATAGKLFQSAANFVRQS
jgi:hypothetical protein